MSISVIIRTLNEDKYLEELLISIKKQQISDSVEIIIVDSGSTDRTLEISEKYKCVITKISKEDFTFGRSLNIGCDLAKGDILVLISGHCIPTNSLWLQKLVEPIKNRECGYSYGRQVGRDTTKFSEERLFEKYFPAYDGQHISNFFCNNANAAIDKNIWKKYKFNEDLTGLEDMELAKRFNQDNGCIKYVSESCVFHIHNESSKQTKRRYEREAIALQKIMPEIQVTFPDFILFLLTSILSDFKHAQKDKVLLSQFISIIKFRFAQYWGTYQGNKPSRLNSNLEKNKYFYPK